MRDRVVLLVASAAVIALCFLAPSPSRSQQFDMPEGRHGDGHRKNHDWYRNLKQPGTGFSCCNGDTAEAEGDCRPTRAFRDDNGNWMAMIDGIYVPVPPRVVLKQLAPDGSSHICASKSGLIYCFLGGSPKI